MMIEVLNGVRYQPEQFLARMEKSNRLKGVKVCHVNTIYSLCWVFQYRIRMQASKKSVRYGGYYAGFDESVMAPGKLAMLPSATSMEVPDECVLADKLTEEEALRESWEYNKRGVLRKFRNLYAAPELEDYVAERFYKPLYVFSFYHEEYGETKYRVLDSLTGDLEEIQLR